MLVCYIISMNKKSYLTFGVIVLAVIALLLVRANWPEPIIGPGTEDQRPQGKLVTGSELETFSGTITGVDTGCFSDGICSVSVDNKKVILVKGGRGLPPDTKVGKLLGVESIGDLEQNIGQHANVYAAPTPEGDYTLYGNNDYYVEVVK
jgi:hypothetical protein